MESRLQWILAQLTRRLWFRAALFGVAAILTTFIAGATSRFFPDNMSNVIGSDAVESILQILASSMLAVSTFSLGTMVSAFAAASSNATPRASKLLIEDTTSQNALATFIGAFVFSLIGIIALKTHYYGAGGRVVMFIMTLLVVLLVIATLFKWIDYLSHLGRLSEVAGKVEAATLEATRSRRDYPYLGANPMTELPDDTTPVTSDEIAYIQHIDVSALDEIAKECNGKVYVNCLPGVFSDSVEPLANTSWPATPDEKARIRNCFFLGDERSFHQDPRFGLIVLGEIASRALSPGINDPGTAINVINRIIRVLAVCTNLEEPDDSDIEFHHVYVPGIEIRDLFDDGFNPIARDGAGQREVTKRLLKALASLASMGGKTFKKNALRHTEIVIKYAEAAPLLKEEIIMLKEQAKRVEAAASS